MFRTALTVLLISITAIASIAADKPNAVIVITDDQGHSDLSCHGNPILKTPQIDKLYSESVRLTDYHVSNFYGMIANIDQNVGRMRQFLDEQGLTENTIFIFTTDNGSSSGTQVFNSSMRGAKGSPYDGGHRVPFSSIGPLENYRMVARLTKFYEKLWTELEPCFSISTAISLGHPADNPARLTSHDWITTEMTSWNQAQVRNAINGAENTGFWNVNIVESGTYEVRLRRWPAEADAAIDAELKAGPPVQGERPFRATIGRAIQPVKATLQIGDQTASTAVAQGAKEVPFKLELKAGKTTMTALFITADGTEYGAYYAYVAKK